MVSTKRLLESSLTCCIWTSFSSSKHLQCWWDRNSHFPDKALKDHSFERKTSSWSSDFCRKRNFSYSGNMYVSYWILCASIVCMATCQNEARADEWCSIWCHFCLSQVWLDAAVYFLYLVWPFHQSCWCFPRQQSTPHIGWTFNTYIKYWCH